VINVIRCARYQRADAPRMPPRHARGADRLRRRVSQRDVGSGSGASKETPAMSTACRVREAEGSTESSGSAEATTDFALRDNVALSREALRTVLADKKLSLRPDGANAHRLVPEWPCISRSAATARLDSGTICGSRILRSSKGLGGPQKKQVMVEREGVVRSQDCFRPGALHRNRAIISENHSTCR
jgi:hypothetical protein